MTQHIDQVASDFGVISSHCRTCQTEVTTIPQVLAGLVHDWPAHQCDPSPNERPL